MRRILSDAEKMYLIEKFRHSTTKPFNDELFETLTFDEVAFLYSRIDAQVTNQCHSYAVYAKKIENRLATLQDGLAMIENIEHRS